SNPLLQFFVSEPVAVAVAFAVGRLLHSLPRLVQAAAPPSPVTATTAEQEAMLHHHRSAAASSPGRLPAPPEDAGDEDDEESMRAVAVSDQRTIYLVNMFIANTVEFLNSFAATCDDKLALLHRKIVKLDSSLALLEARLYSIDENNAPGHSSASQKTQQSLSDDKIFCSDVGESSRCGDS
ncbi:unnamed protein product, partial [Urochloa humidicola]